MNSPDKPLHVDPLSAVSVHELCEVRNLSASEIDNLPYGVIQVDQDGVVLAYNETEAALSRMPAKDVIGRNFFTDIAPCTNVQEFAGRFRAGVKRGRLLEIFPFYFEFSKRRRVNVLITFLYEPPDERAWIFVKVRE